MSTDTSTTVDSEATITFGPSAAKAVLTALGYEINDDGLITMDGEVVTSPISGSIVTLEEFGGFRRGDDGSPRIVKQNDPIPTTTGGN